MLTYAWIVTKKRFFQEGTYGNKVNQSSLVLFFSMYCENSITSETINQLILRLELNRHLN